MKIFKIEILEAYAMEYKLITLAQIIYKHTIEDFSEDIAIYEWGFTNESIARGIYILINRRINFIKYNSVINTNSK